MNDYGCRIGKVRMKDKKLVALPVRPRTGKAIEMPASCANLIDCCDGDVGGYVLVAWNKYGFPFVSWHNDQTIMPMYILPGFLAQAMQVELSQYFTEEE